MSQQRTKRRRTLDREIASYAPRFAGTTADLDPAFERAGFEVLRRLDDKPVPKMSGRRKELPRPK